MRRKNTFLGIVLLIGSGLADIYAQQAVLPAGSNASGSGGNISYTIGQLVYTVITGTNGSAVQGVQQPYEISIVTGIKETEGITLESYIFPNPATEFIVLKIEDFKTDDLSYQFFDINGKLLGGNKINGSSTQIPMSHLANSVYFLKVIFNKEEVVKTFKIIKN